MGHLPWEAEGGVLARFAGTCRRAITEPSVAFTEIGEGPLGPPARFAFLSSVLGLSPLLVFLPVIFVALAMREAAFPLLTTLPCALVFYPSLSFLYFTAIGALFHAAALAFGGRASFAASLRAGWYSSAWEPISAATLVFYCIPVLNLLVMLAGVPASAIWRTFALQAFAQRTHGLSPGRARLVAAFSAGIWALAWYGVVVAIVGFAIYERLHR